MGENSNNDKVPEWDDLLTFATPPKSGTTVSLWTCMGNKVFPRGIPMSGVPKKKGNNIAIFLEKQNSSVTLEDLNNPTINYVIPLKGVRWRSEEPEEEVAIAEVSEEGGCENGSRKISNGGKKFRKGDSQGWVKGQAVQKGR